MKNKFMIITDLEATCWEQKSPNDFRYQKENSEIIEIGAIKVSLDKDNYLEIIKEFDVFIKPIRHPVLSDFCRNLTSITQEQVDKGIIFEEAILRFKEDMFDEPATLFGSWGKYDFNFMKEQCEKYQVPVPFDSQKVINLKSLVASIKGWKKKGLGIGRSLKELNMEFEGTPHRGIEDVRNIRRIMLKMKDNLNL